MADFLDILTKLVVKHEKLYGVLPSIVLEHAQLVLSSLERCCCNGCRTEATVRHQTLGVKCCDRCAARLITKAKKGMGTDPSLDPLRAAVMQEELWVDLPNAVAIRRAQDLVTMETHKNEPDTPERGSTEWQ